MRSANILSTKDLPKTSREHMAFHRIPPCNVSYTVALGVNTRAYLSIESMPLTAHGSAQILNLAAIQNAVVCAFHFANICWTSRDTAILIRLAMLPQSVKQTGGPSHEVTTHGGTVSQLRWLILLEHAWCCFGTDWPAFNFTATFCA